jgi:hypothetical protein
MTLTYTERRKLGLCTDCAGKAEDGFTRCNKDRETNRVRTLKAWRKKHKPKNGSHNDL